MLKRPAQALLCVLAFAVATLVARGSHAQTTTLERLIENLARSEDFRVRTQAALALGASKNQRAVQPLCDGLADANTTVRAAAAAALGRLSLGGRECLEQRMASETSDVVKAAIARSLELLMGGAEPLFVDTTKFYISIGKATDKTGRTPGEVEALLRAAMLGKISQTEGFLAAPASETPPEAKRRLAKHPTVKGYFLSPGVSPPDYSGGNLKVRIEVAMLSYPEKNLLGSFSVNLTEPGVSPGSLENENELLRMAAERAIDKFAVIAANQ
jgi:hypothetical protein